MDNEKRRVSYALECSEEHEHHTSDRALSMPNERTLYELADFFKIFGDSTRINILFACDGDPICVCDIAEMLGMTKSAVSHQLAILRGANLVKVSRRGKTQVYAIADEHVRLILDMALLHGDEE